MIAEYQEVNGWTWFMNFPFPCYIIEDNHLCSSQGAGLPESLASVFSMGGESKLIIRSLRMF